MINDAINKLVQDNLDDSIDFIEVFDEIFSGLADDTQTSSFLSLLESKNIEKEIYYNGIVSARNLSKKVSLPFLESNSFESINFAKVDSNFDLAFLIDLVCASSGLNVAKYSFDCGEFINNSFRVFKELKLNIPTNFDDFSVDFEKTGFYYFNFSENQPFKYSEKTIRKLPFDCVLKNILKMLSPYNFKNQFIAVQTKKEVDIWANVALKLNNLNTMIVTGADDFPYVSLWGESFIAEAWKNKIFTYIVTPDLLGFKEAQINDIECENIQHFLTDLKEIFKDGVMNPKCDIVVLNSALALYITKKVDSIMDGIDLAKKLISDGKVWEKFEQIKMVYQ